MRLRLVPVLGLVLLALSAGPAAADAGPGADAPYYRSRLIAVSPSIPGISVTVTATGDWIRVANSTGTPLLVLGYSGEPYLRIGPSGVDENTGSLSASLNASLVISQLPPNWTARPEHWVHRSGSPSYAWHDHRIHWMSASRPPAVRADPQHPQHVSDWTVRMVYGSTPVQVTGTLDWLGRPGLLTGTLSRVLWGVAALAGLALTVQLIRTARTARAARSARRRAPGPARPAEP